MTPTFHFPAGQHFECRDCASRCCSLPWKVLATEEEKQRFEAQEWIRQRLAEHDATLEPVGDGLYRLPAIERNRRLECIFLDPDGLCSQVKHHGPEFWTRTCRTFPFDFVELEEGQVQASLSHYCPSIRDNYGKPVADQVEKFFATHGSKPRQIAQTMQIGGLTELTRHQYLRLTAVWREHLAATASLPQALIDIYDLTQALAVALLNKNEISDAEFDDALQTVQKEFTSEKLPTQKPTFLARLLLSCSLCRMSYPIWLGERKGQKKGLRAAWQAYQNTFRILNGRGMVDFLLLPKAFDLAAAADIPAILSDPAMVERLKRFFGNNLERGMLFLRPRSINGVLADLVLGLAILLRAAKYSAAAYGRKEVAPNDLGEGIGYAELLALYHVSRMTPPPIVEFLLTMLADNRPAIVGLLTVEK